MALLLIRHAKAGSRREWPGDDLLRPVSRAGAAQAESLIPLLAPFRVRRVLSSPFLRCVQTVEPLARAAGMDVEEVDELAEGRAGKAIALVSSLIGGPPVALCTHGDVVPDVLEWATDDEGAQIDGPARCPKGSTWVFDDEDGRIVRARYLPPPA